MKIGGAPPPIPPFPRQERPAGPDGDRQGGRGTFGFDELGVFGLRRRPAAADPEPGARTPRCPAPGGPSVKPPDKNSRPDAASPPARATDARRPEPPPRPKPDRPHSGDDPSRPGPRPVPHGVEVGAGEPPEVPFEPVAEPVRKDMDAAGPLHRAPARKAMHGVTVAESEGRLSIAVGAPPLDGEGRALLRRLVRELLAERGLALADFQLNGVPLAADFQMTTGGSHGTRPR